MNIIRETYVMEILLGLLLMIIACASIMSTLEPNMENYGDALWYCFALVTTIGFGDISATTLVGRVLSVFLGIYGIVVVAIIINKNPSTLFAGLGAASAILMLAFQDTIKGLVAGIRLTSNDMLHIGDWITVPSAGANGKVEEISLTMVKVRNFDNTIVTVTPQMLVDGAFQNWQGMMENEGRKQVRKVYYDFRSLTIGDDGIANITKFRQHVEQWLKENPKVIGEKNPLVRQAEAAQAGCCVEFIFWLKAQNAVDFEHDTSDIMEYIFAKGGDFGLRIYQQFPEQ
jgi:miniconductance mechanosensitive channel